MRKHLALALAALVWGGCAHTDPQPARVPVSGNPRASGVSIEPRLGEPIPFSASTDWGILVSASQISPAANVRYRGIVYEVAFDAGTRRIIYVGTRDSGFSTPEGIHVGSTLAETLRVGASFPGTEWGWGYSTALPSGWHAAFAEGKSMTGDSLRMTSTVKWLFRRGRSESLPQTESNGR